MKKLALTAAALSALALPATAAAAGRTTATVLSVSGHSIQVVNAEHVVQAFHFAGRAPKLHAGSVVSFARHGGTISAVKVAGRGRTVSYYASVVKSSSRHVVLRLADQRTVTVSGSKIHGSHDNGAKGATVLVTETVNPDGSITITITIPASGTGPGGTTGTSGTTGAANGEQTINGVVSDVETDTFTVQTNDGSSLVFHMDATDLANIDMFPCDTVVVTYHVASDELMADNVNDNGTSDTGDCADGGTGDSGSDNSGDSSDETGPITRISDSSITINTSDQGSMTFIVDPSEGLTQGFLVGDVVDVTYSPDATSGNDATDIEYVENDDYGAVTSVGAGSITFTDSTTGQPDTFTADPSEQMFAGIDAGDQVDVTYHISNGQPVVDNVDDLTQDAAAGN